MLPMTVVAAENASLTVASVLTDVGSVLTEAINTVSGQPVAVVFIGLAVASAGIGFLKRIIHIR